MCFPRNCLLNARPLYTSCTREILNSGEVSDISLSKDVFEKAVKNALGRVNTSGICNLSQHQLKALFNFLCVKDSLSVCQPVMGNR